MQRLGFSLPLSVLLLPALPKPALLPALKIQKPDAAVLRQGTAPGPHFHIFHPMPQLSKHNRRPPGQNTPRSSESLLSGSEELTEKIKGENDHEQQFFQQAERPPGQAGHGPVQDAYTPMRSASTSSRATTATSLREKPAPSAVRWSRTYVPDELRNLRESVGFLRDMCKRLRT